MLKKIISFIKSRGIGQETVNIVLGVFMLAAFIVYGITKSLYALYSIILIGALINLTTGFSYLKKKEKKTLGTSMITLGFVIIFIFGFFVLR